MSSMSWIKMPFKYRGENDFFAQLDKWIGDVLYDKLPQSGFEVREEQIYTTYYMVKALRERSVLFAEAGSGTGKTFAYILTCLCYARLKGLPVVLSSASPILQEQLTHPHGDIATLSRELGIDIDARLAKSPEHYVCELKVERLRFTVSARERKKLQSWAENDTHGERSKWPDVADEQWAQISWDPSLRCDRCKRKGYCRFAKARKHFQSAKDFVICEHEVFFADLWTREETKFRRHIPYLPDYSAVVFDEGHLVELPMAKTLGRKLNYSVVKGILSDLNSVDGQRISLLEKVSQVQTTARHFFNVLNHSLITDERAERLHIRRTDELILAGSALDFMLEKLQDELVIEESMNEETPYAVAVASYQDRLDLFRQGLSLLQAGTEHGVAWWEPEDSSAYVIPREYAQRLHTDLLSQQLPILFTSATLAAGKSFAYMHHITGTHTALHSQVGVPFALEEQVCCYIATDVIHNDDYMKYAAQRIARLLEITKGRALILCSTVVDVALLRSQLSTMSLPYPLYYEGDASRAKLLDNFRASLESVLIAYSYWEGVDVPGEALSQVIIATLPFPHHDPLVEARRNEAQEMGLDPTHTVDIPAMLIKLRQGFGRLIRSSADRGLISIVDSRPGTTIHPHILEAIPSQIVVVYDLSKVKDLARKIFGF